VWRSPHWGVRAIVALAPGRVLRLQEAAIDARMLVFAVAVGAVTAVAFGLVPALQFSRSSRDMLRERQSQAPRRLFRRSLVAAEIALALILLTGAGLLIRSFDRLLAVDPGFAPENVVALQVFAWDRHGAPERTRAFFASTLERIRQAAGVQEAGAVSAMPFMVANINIKSPLHVVGRDAVGASERSDAYVTIATPGYFEAMRISLREGRFLTEQDTERTAAVAVISEALRRREWPSVSPVGQRIRLRLEGEWSEAEIVGVVGEIRHEGLDRPSRPEIFLPLQQRPFASMTYVVRGTGDPAALVAALKREVWAVDPRQTFYDVATVSSLVDSSVVRQRFGVTLMSGFAILALALCAAGVYGLISFTTAQRTHEIGVRMALGASGGSIRTLVLRDGCVLIASGLAVGAAGALAVSRVLQTLLFEVEPGDPLTLAAASAMLGIVGAAACYFPARRATRVEPILALRTD
jgi:predicted permease